MLVFHHYLHGVQRDIQRVVVQSSGPLVDQMGLSYMRRWSYPSHSMGHLHSNTYCNKAHIRNKSITHSLNTGHQQSPDQGRGQTPYSARLLTGRVQLAMPQATVGQFPTLKTEQEPTTQNFTHKQTLHKDHNMMKTKL